MSTQQTANVYVKNNTDGNAEITLVHQNSSNGVQQGTWTAGPGATVGPLTVYFQTGIGSWGILDYWWISLSVRDGSKPGVYTCGGSITSPTWKECQLQSSDAGQSLTFTVDTATFGVNEKSGACSAGMVYRGPYSKIKHVFVLMLENHSFDNLFALSGIPGITAATPANSNSFYDQNSKKTVVCNVVGNAPVTMPSDPGHEFADTLEQLAGVGSVYHAGGAYPAINNSGFASNYATTTTEGAPPPSTKVGNIMACFDTPRQLPVMYQLATEFALCDHWFSSIPGPTWPNRFFVHGASSAGLEHSPSSAEIAIWEGTPDGGFVYPHGSIYDAMNRAGIQWRLYNDYDDSFSDDPHSWGGGFIAQVASLKGIHQMDVNRVTSFASDLESAYPYTYTFIEPNYGDVLHNTYIGGSSQHPMDDVYGGERLVKMVYESIRNSPLWDSSLLIITYDEHGGFYDSVAPGSAPAPNDGSPSTLNQTGFTFEQYGVRVPAIIVSPWIAKGVVDKTVYDHASVLATVERMFGLNPLTQRDANANDFRHLLSQPAPRTDCPARLNDPAPPQATKALLSDEALSRVENQPLPESGNLIGFLHVALKTDLELSAGDEVVREGIFARFNSIKTRGDANAYINEVKEKVAAAQSI